MCDSHEAFVDRVARELARLSYVRTYGAHRAERWPEDVDGYCENTIALHRRDAVSLLARLLPPVAAALPPLPHSPSAELAQDALSRLFIGVPA